jgi:hypothetical protein
VTPFLSLLYLSLVKILLHCYKALATFFRSHAIHFTAVHCTFLFPKETKKNTREAIYCPLSVTPFLSLLYMSLVQIMLHCYKALATFFRSHAIQLTALHLKRQKKNTREAIYCPLSVTPFLSLLFMSLVQIMLHCYKALATFFRSHAIQFTAVHCTLYLRQISVTPFSALLSMSLVKIILHCYKALVTFPVHAQSSLPLYTVHYTSTK